MVPSLTLPVLSQGTFPVIPLEPADEGMCASPVADFFHASRVTNG
jgi:hypothetical protein